MVLDFALIILVTKLKWKKGYQNSVIDMEIFVDKHDHATYMNDEQ